MKLVPRMKRRLINLPGMSLLVMLGFVTSEGNAQEAPIVDLGSHALNLAESNDPEAYLGSVIGSHLDTYASSKLGRLLGDVDVSINGLLGGKPQFQASSIRPIYESEDLRDTFFSQATLGSYDSRHTLNFGLGYRRMSADEHWLLGVNAFYDHEFPYDHRRASLGLEARSSVIEFNTNRYFALSDWKVGRDGLNEAALGGYDLELGLTMPYVPGAKLYHKEFTWYSVDGIADVTGGETSLQLHGDLWVPGLSLEVGATRYDGARKGRNFVQISYNFPPKGTKGGSFVSREMYSFSSMKNRRLDKVRRQNTIVKQFQGRGTITFR